MKKITKKMTCKITFVLTILTFSLILETGCKSSDVESKNEIQIPEEPEDPPNIAFAKKLQAELEKNNIKGAINLYSEIPDELSGDIDLKILLASLYYSDSQFENSKATAQEVLLLDSQNMQALEILAMIAKQTGNNTDFKNVSNQILSVDPYNSSINIQIANDYLLNKRYKLARNTYKKALENDKKNTDALFGYGLTSFYLSDVDEAEETFQKILDIDPENSSALAYMGKIYAEDQNYFRAENYVRAAIENEPNNYDYYMDLGSYLRYEGKFNEAEEAWKKAAEIDPSYFLAHAYLAGFYDEQNRFDDARKSYQKVIETNPDYFYAYESLAILEFHSQNWENSALMFEKAYSYSKDYSYKLMSGAALFKTGDKFNAQKLLKAELKNLERNSLEYDMVRFYAENYNVTAERALINKINKEENRNKRGKMLYYMGLYYELNDFEEQAVEYYSKVCEMSAPMFFEFRLAEWGLGINQ